jgi:hypothetical protein
MLEKTRTLFAIGGTPPDPERMDYDRRAIQDHARRMAERRGLARFEMEVFDALDALTGVDDPEANNLRRHLKAILAEVQRLAREASGGRP